MLPDATATGVDDLNLLPEWREPLTREELLISAAGSLLINALLFVGIVSLPDIEPIRTKPQVPDLTKAVHLVAPKFFEPTQKAPNKGKITRALDVHSMQQSPASRAPKFRPPEPAPGPVASGPPSFAPPVIDQPKIQVAEAPVPPIVNTPQPVRSQQAVASAGSQEKPKLAFESVSAQPIHVVPPNAVQLPMPKSGAGGTVVGDIGDSATTIPNLSNVPSPGRIGSNLQLLSDPKGVDFKPYLIQVLTAVRRNWLAVIPESARMGRRGRVLIQFAIDRAGGVPKLVIAEGAGADSLDRAAVTSISASYPFPPLPAEYKGDQIRVQLAFSYNLPAQ